jgi:thiosulfate reductase cytochrome b subunit
MTGTQMANPRPVRARWSLSATKVIHPGPFRVMHWLNAIAIITRIGSGWEIYDASPFLPFTFPEWATIGQWLGGAIA